jgi:chromosome segregation ATPase
MTEPTKNLELIAILNALDTITKRLTKIERQQKKLADAFTEMYGDFEDVNNRIDVLAENIDIVNDDLESFIEEDTEYDNIRTDMLNENTENIESTLKTFALRFTNLEK